MLVDIEYLDLKQYNKVVLPLNTFCARCDHIMVKGRPVTKIDGATFVHLSCPDLPLRNISTNRRNETRTAFKHDGTTLSYEPVAVVDRG
jgi:hypothetical protein